MAETDDLDAASLATRVDDLCAGPDPYEVADEAMALARQALALITPQGDPELWVRLTLAFGRLALMTGYDREDLALLRSSVAANAAVQAHQQAASGQAWFRGAYNGALGMIYLGRLADDAAPLEDAATQLSLILRVWPRDAPEGQWASAMNTLGTALQNAGLIRGQSRPARRAAACYRIAARAYAASGFAEDARNSTYNEGLAWTVFGDLTGQPDAYDRAIRIYGTVLADAAPDRDLRDWAKIVDAIARARANRGDVTGDAAAIRQAIDDCESVIAAMPRDRHPGWWAMVMSGLCDYRLRLATLQGDPAGMLAAAEGAGDALKLAQRDAMPTYWLSLMRTAARARLHLGRQTSDVAQIAQAVALMAEIVDTGLGGPRERAAVLVLRGRANHLRAMLEPQQAAPSLRKALHDLDAALALIDRHAAPALWADIVLARAQARHRLGLCLGDAPGLAAAADGYRAALVALPLAEGSPGRGAALVGAARARLARVVIARDDDPAGIASQLGAARSALRQDLDPTAAIELARDRATAFVLAQDWDGAATEASGQIDHAAALIAAEPTEHERLRLADVLSGMGDLAAYALLRLGRTDAALARHEQGRAHRLRARLRLAEANLDGAQTARLDRLRQGADTARRALAQALDQARPSGVIARLGAALKRDHRALLDAMRDAGLDKPEVPPGVAAIRDMMADGVVAIPIMTPAGGALLVIGGRALAFETQTLWLDALTTRAVEDLLAPAGGGGWLVAFARFRGALSAGGAPAGAAAVLEFQTAIDRTAQECWALLMDPLDRLLRRAGVPAGTEVVLIPDGRLSALPLHAAGGAADTFLDRWAVSHAPSIAALASCRRKARVRGRAPGRMLAVTDPTSDLGRIVNPATAAMPPDRTDMLYGPDATRAAVIKALPTADYVSFFSHAVWDPVHPERSALELAGGDRLTADDMAALDLERCRMVMLGACESGVPGLTTATDEFRGVPAALLEAGIPGVLATLWPVFTETVDGMVADFARHHIVEGMPPAKALRRAQLAMRGAGQRVAMASPMGMRPAPLSSDAATPVVSAHDLGLSAHWAAFVHIGA